MVLFLYLLGILCFTVIESVDRSKFRTCQDTGFCRKWRSADSNFYNQYEISQKPPILTSGAKSGEWGVKLDTVKNEKNSAELYLAVNFLASGAIRCKISEKSTPRWQPSDILMPEGLLPGKYRELQPSTSSEDASLLPKVLKNSPALWDSFIALLVLSDENKGQKTLLVVHRSPLRLELFLGDLLQLTVNGESLLHWEKGSSAPAQQQLSQNDEKESKDVDRHHGKEVVDYGEDGLAIYADGSREERVGEVLAANNNEVDSSDYKADSFGGHLDSRPRGPRSVGVDVAFNYARNVFGLPEHTASLSLPTTKQGPGASSAHFAEPYRLYSLDVFEYELDQPMALYGSIPLLLAHAVLPDVGGVTTGVFWFNPSETFVDIWDGGSPASPHRASHWIAESGEVDLFLLPGPTPAHIYRQYTKLTGTQQLPPLFSLGYHQCRWNYRDEKDVAAVEKGFEDLDFPYDVLWLDIEHTDGKRYFTWDKALFPNPIEMQRNLSAHGRKMVTIVDPHIKRDSNYHIHKEAESKGLYIKQANGVSDFDGWCWPGSSSYLDFTCSDVRQWWAEQFSLDKYKGSTMDLFTWNDMNEPSVFNGPEVSMPKDAKNRQGVEHREWHNLFGFYMQMATALGLTIRSPADSEQERPFVLTRSFWAGSQRYGAMWTGDNSAQWGHLQIAAPMLLAINLGGLSFAGADVGGFFGEPDAELFTRWYQAGSFTPFFRGHAHHDTKRREPWVFGDPYTGILRQAALLRYSLLPYWYSVFHEAYRGGLPVMRAMFLEFPDDSDGELLSMDDQWMIGSALLVKPATSAGQREVSVYLPGGGSQWFALDTLRRGGPSAVRRVAVHTPLEKIPVYIRAGKIIPRKMRLRRSSKLMFFDPFTLTVCPSASTGGAEGEVYLDDEHSLAHQTVAAFAVRALTYTSSVDGKSASLRCHAASGDQGNYEAPNTVERVVIAGQKKAPSRVTLSAPSTEVALEFTFDAENETVTIKKPNAKISEDWTLSLSF